MTSPTHLKPPEFGRGNLPGAHELPGEMVILRSDDGYSRQQLFSDGTKWLYAAMTEFVVSAPAPAPSPPSVPTLTALPAIAGTATSGQTLSASPGAWTGSPTSFSYQWKRAGTVVTGAVGTTYLLTDADIGSTMTVSVIAINGQGSSAAATSTATSAVAPSSVPAVPSNTSVPTISGTTTVGQVLTGSPGSWTGSPSSYAYQWNRSGSPISGATSSNYTLVSGDLGATITLSVIATNGTGSSSAATSAATATVAAPAADTRPRYGVGGPTDGVSAPAALLASLTPTGSNNSKVASFSIAPGAGQYGWFACLASLTVPPAGVTFTVALGSGGWDGAASSGPNGGDTGDSPNVSTVTYNDGTNVWRFYRQSYANAGDSFTTS